MSSVAVDFSKKSIVFITGASKGIGQTIAVELSRHLNQNSIFVLLARTQEGLDETKHSISEVDKSLTVLTYIVDLSKPDLNTYNDLFVNVLEKIDTAGIEFGYIFHNAAHVGVLKETTELVDLQTWREYFDLNLFSAILLNNAFLQKIRPVAPQLVVVNITSLVGRVPFSGMSMYGTGKASREIFFKVLAVEQPKLIVLNYSPGPVLTDMFNSVCDTAENSELKQNFQDMRKLKNVLTTDQTTFAYKMTDMGPLLFLLKLAWDCRYRLPLLITVGFVVLDVRMQLDINVQMRQIPRPRPNHRSPRDILPLNESQETRDPGEDNLSDSSWTTFEEQEITDDE